MSTKKTDVVICDKCKKEFLGATFPGESAEVSISLLNSAGEYDTELKIDLCSKCRKKLLKLLGVEQ